MTTSPIRVALVNDFEIVVVGLQRMFEQYGDRIEVVEMLADEPVRRSVDVALYDTFAQTQGDRADLEALLANRRADKVVVYTWNFDDDIVNRAMERGASGYLSKTMPAGALVEALEEVVSGKKVVCPPPGHKPTVGGDWPGRAEGLSNREAEIIALITQGLSNREVAERACLGANTVKSYIRSAYRKMGVKSRTQAVLWGLEHGFKSEPVRISGEDVASGASAD